MSIFDNEDTGNRTHKPSDRSKQRINQQQDLRIRPSGSAEQLAHSDPVTAAQPSQMRQATRRSTDAKTPDKTIRSSGQATSPIHPTGTHPPKRNSTRQPAAERKIKPQPAKHRSTASYNHTDASDRLVDEPESNVPSSFTSYWPGVLLLIMMLVAAVFISRNGRDIDTLQQQPEKNANNATTLQLSDLTSRISAVEQQLSDVKQALDSLQTQSTQNTSQFIDVKQLDVLNNKIAQLRSELPATQAGTPASSVKQTTSVATTSNNQTTNLWVIAIAALSNRDRAELLHNRAKKLGVDARIEAIKSSDKPLWRVRAYGYATRDSAQQDLKRLQNDLGISGLWITRDKP